MGKFDDKVVIVTGSSSGIGEATAVAFAKEGAAVTICGRNAELLSAVANKCKRTGAEVFEFIGDLRNFENLELLIKRTMKRFGRLDILVNNAGIGHSRIIENLEVGDYERLFQVNLRAPVFLSRYALPHLKRTKGCIVNVSSVSALIPFPAGVPYCMTKAALDHFTRGFATECVASGVRVNSVNPAVVETRIAINMGLPKDVADGIKAELLAGQPFGIISSEQIADAVLFLCESPMITGISLPVDGGSMLPTSVNPQNRAKSRL